MGNPLRKILILVFLIITSIASAKTYYVSTTGKDSNPGTFSQPWLTWNFAFNNTPPSDTCYFRGGIYNTSIGVLLRGGANDGTYSHPTCFLNYPGEVPVLDCQTMPNVIYENVGLAIRNANNLYIKGLTVKNVRQWTEDDLAVGIFVSFTADPTQVCNNIRFENCTAHHIGGHGFHTGFSDTLYFINCDAYSICDSLTAYDPGGWGTGFGLYGNGYVNSEKSYFYLEGCRAWKCSDQGFSSFNKGATVFNNCWAINNGHYRIPNVENPMKGSGFKMWYSTSDVKNPLVRQLTLYNCLAVDNELRGFNSADDSGSHPEIRAHFFNNFAFRNGYTHEGNYIYGHGFWDCTNMDTVGRWDHWYINNLSYKNSGAPTFSGRVNGDFIPGAYHQATNEWDILPETISDADFVSLDTTGLCSARQADGSLPNTNFGHLASTSELIDAGSDVGLVHNGIAPDIGAFEYSGIISNQKPATSITITGAGGATKITTNKGTLQLNATVLPSDATNKTVTWSIINSTGQATISSTGLLTAGANGTITAKATANDGSGVFGTLVITISNQVIPVNGITISGAGGTDLITSIGGSLQLSAAISPSNATVKTVTWSAVNGTGQATVNSSGLVTAVGSGTVTILATANDGSNVSGSLVITINAPPVIVVDYQQNSYSGFVCEIDASSSYDPNKDNLTYTWEVPDKLAVSSTTGSAIKYLSPIVNSIQTVEFKLQISDGKTTQSMVIPIKILPYEQDLEVAEISDIEASSYQTPYYPHNIVDGNIGTMWSAYGENQWLIIELAQSFWVQHVKLAFYPGQRRESYFEILGSVDKLNWESILIKTASCDFSGDPQVFEFPPSKTGKKFNYVKLVGFGNSDDKWNFFSEIKIFGYYNPNSHSNEKAPVKIYPNPAKEYVTIRVDEPSFAHDFIQLVDLTGIVVFREKINPDLKEYTIPINLKKGIYIIQLIHRNITLFTQKLFVTRY